MTGTRIRKVVVLLSKYKNAEQWTRTYWDDLTLEPAGAASLVGLYDEGEKLPAKEFFIDVVKASGATFLKPKRSRGIRIVNASGMRLTLGEPRPLTPPSTQEP